MINLICILAAVATTFALLITLLLIGIWREFYLLRTGKTRVTPTLQEIFGRPVTEPRQHRSRS